MNKRPLFWAVMCFAFGEVMYIFADEGRQIGTAAVVLICAVIVLLRLRLATKYKIIYIAFILAGILRIWWEDMTYLGDVLYGGADYESIQEYYEGYTVSCGRQDNSESCTVSGVGVVDQIALGSSGYNVTVSLRETYTDGVIIYEETKVIVYGVSAGTDIGDRVELKGRLNYFVPSGNPGEFDRASYYMARGVVGYGNGSSMELKALDRSTISLGLCEGLWYEIKNCLYHARVYFMDRLGLIAAPEIAATYSGILLGEKSGIPEEDMLLYRLCGIAHIFAISGLHISIVGGLLYKCMRRLGISFLKSAVIAMTITLLYGVMTGFSFSTIRAVVMLALSLGGEVLGRRYDMVTGIGAALLLLLVAQPYRIMDGGLLLSFGAVAGVAMSKYIIRVLEENTSLGRLKRKKTRRFYGALTAIVFSTIISLVTNPIIAYMYYQIPLYSALVNVIIVPLMSLTVFCGFFGVIMSVISTGIGSLIIWPGALSLRLYQFMCSMIMKLPGAVINTGRPDILHIVIYYLILFVILVLINPRNISGIRRYIKSRTGRWITYGRLRFIANLVMVGMIATAGITIGLLRYIDQGDSIVFLDVGQGDGILIRTETGVNMAIDVGSTSNDGLGEYVAIPGLLSEGMGNIDYWFITHLDADHTSGLMYILQSDIDIGIDIDNIVISEHAMWGDYPSELIELAEDKGINIIHMKAGDCISDGEFYISAVHPGAGFDVEDKNEQSLVLEYRVRSFSALFTGDIGMAAINNILETRTLDLKEYDVIKIPHHGSKYSSSQDFIDRVNPTVAIISCGAYNMYGHPHDETLRLLDDALVDVYRTDKLGAVVLDIH